MSLPEFAIIESTLREGEQFIGSSFSSDDKVEIAEALNEFGVEYIELTSPQASPQSFLDCKRIAKLGLGSKVLTHIRCYKEDAKIALDTGVDGINMVIGTSKLLRQYGHGRSINQIIDLAIDVLTYIHEQNPQMEVRFSTEDSFRSSMSDLLKVYLAIEQLGFVNRFGLADTVGIATPIQVYELVKTLRRFINTDIEFHGHNDTGCAIANSYSALEAGATHIDTTVLGIGERNGITPLAGMIARMYPNYHQIIKQKYKLEQLKPLHQLIANKVGITIPFDHYIVGSSAFNHKAGIHTKAMISNPSTYEAINPEDFELTRNILIAHKLTGWHAISAHIDELGLNLDKAEIKNVTKQIKALADLRNLTIEDIDRIIYSVIRENCPRKETTSR